ncbi:glycosyl hydrolase family 65 protein [Paenibacillus sp. N3.4]|uniref:glycosyl hydrolase family 65 protein n=1 Tax=Paenibacillus sp. N3.4 TaxID=2603222 RepID=UPI0037C53F0D
MDLDDEQDTAASGLHGASLGGTWQAVVNGFGGLRVIEGQLHLAPIIPEKWKKLSFNIHFNGRLIGISITEKATEVKLISGDGIELFINRNSVKI